MKLRLWCVLAGMVLGAAGPLPAADEASSLKERFTRAQSGLRSLQAGLTQTLQLGGMRRPAVSTGSLCYQAPDRLAVVYDQPAGQEVRAAGDVLWLKRREGWSRRSLATDAAGKPVSALLSLLRGSTPPEARDYEESVVRDGSGWLVRLTPRGEPAPMAPRRIETRLGGEPPEVRSVTVFLPDNGVLIYELRDVKRDVPVDAARFAAPAGEGAR